MLADVNGVFEKKSLVDVLPTTFLKNEIETGTGIGYFNL